MMFARVAVDRYVDRLFDYAVPQDMEGIVRSGTSVLIDFRGKTIPGIVADVSPACSVSPEKVKPLLSLGGSGALLDEKSLRLARWMSDYYCAPLGMVLRCMMPSEVAKNVRKRSRRKTAAEDSSLDTYLPPVPHVLNTLQRKALERITGNLRSGVFGTFLIHGVTGSGKTEVYLHAIQAARELGRSSIVIVPEIALTPQMIEIFRTRFSDVALYHSRLSPRDRREFWLGMKQGRYSVVIGARSAVFAPFANPGLIIVDEEHEHTYKQGDIPLYNARDVAVMRGKISSCTVVLGSATPSLESYANCEKGKYALLTLPERVDRKELPEVKVVDMNQEIKKTKGRNPVLSGVLLDAIQKRLQTGEQSILFLNRRGYATFVFCKTCGHIARCENCSITLTLHRSESSLHCHRCDHRAPLFRTCPACGGSDIKEAGTGTEKVERQLCKIFPDAKVGRMDTDVTRRKGSYEEVLGEFRRGKVDILVGTQMIAKGLDIPNVTLVGIVAADMALNIPDFHSAEQTFQLITQVAGRAGRGAVKGDVILQTFAPEHPVIRFASLQDYKSFYELERQYRRELRYPPEIRFINVLFRGQDEVELARFAHSFAARLKLLFPEKGVFLKGPHPSPVKRVNKNYRWNLIIGTRDVISTAAVLKKSGAGEGERVQIVYDVDPVSLL